MRRTHDAYISVPMTKNQVQGRFPEVILSQGGAFILKRYVMTA